MFWGFLWPLGFVVLVFGRVFGLCVLVKSKSDPKSEVVRRAIFSG